MRRLIITLAWFSPINPDNRKFRKASLFFEPKESIDTCKVKREDADGNQVKNGTVQHEILEGNKLISFQDGDKLTIPIICKEEAGKLDDDVYYGLAVTLEVSDKIDISLYEEIRDKLRDEVSDRVRIPVRDSD